MQIEQFCVCLIWFEWKAVQEPCWFCFIVFLAALVCEQVWVDDPSDLLCSGNAALRSQIMGRWRRDTSDVLCSSFCFSQVFYPLFSNQTRFMNAFKQAWGTLLTPELNILSRVGSLLIYVRIQCCKIWS